MPIKRIISQDGLFVHTSVYGVVTAEDLISHEEAMITEPAIRLGFCELFDASKVTEIKITKEDIKRVADMDNQNIERFGGSKCAIVVSQSEGFELAKYFEKISRQNYVKVIVFNSVTTAKTWLGVNDTVET
jgi:hypothetical protein